MPLRSIFLKRRRRRQCIEFFENLLLSVQSGYDISYAWNLTAQTLGFTEFEITRQKTLLVTLQNLCEDEKDPELRTWLGVIGELSLTGSPLTPPLSALVDALRTSEDEDWDGHERTLPTRINILVLLFYLPAAFLLFFTPILLGIVDDFALSY